MAQVLATRADFFTQEYLDELKELHDQIPAMKHKEFQKVFDVAFEEKNIFKSFNETPIASASIGQVHVAYLQDNTKVAVKLRRLGIKEQVLADIKILDIFNKLFQPFFSFYTKNSIDAVISEFSAMIKEEVNLSTELHNLEQFSATYEKQNIHFPKAFPKYCSSDALVMSFEDGFRFDDKENIFKHNIDFKAVIANLVNFYTEQMLITGFFHADPHPGNILINKDSQIIFLDFGMVKTVPNNTRIAIIELIKAANEQDYEAYIQANKKLGTIAYEAPVDQLAQFTAKMFSIFSNENLDSESMQKLAFEVLETTRDFPFKLPSDAIYILRVSAIIEGLGTTYIENFNGVKDILPILQKNIPKALGAGESITETIIDEFSQLPFFIQNFKKVINKASEGSLEVELSKPQLEYIFKSLQSYTKSIAIGFSLMLSGFFLLFIDKELLYPATILFGIGLIKIFYK